MIRSQKNREHDYIVFWKTRTEYISNIHKISTLATLMKMVERDEAIQLWGRCEGIIIEDEFYYTGFVLVHTADIKGVMAKYDPYLYFTGKHRYSNLHSARNLLKMLKK